MASKTRSIMKKEIKKMLRSKAKLKVRKLKKMKEMKVKMKIGSKKIFSKRNVMHIREIPRVTVKNLI